MGSWAICLSSLWLNFLICKMGMIRSIFFCVRIEQNNTYNSALYGVSITLVLTTIGVFILDCYVTNTQLKTL